MKLITTHKELENEFKRLLKHYSEFYWATAWAGESQMLDELVKHKSKIKNITVGIHFYQTHPKFIEIFLDDERVRFIQQPEGTFHPKLYLFFNSDDNWEMLVGSSNFTKSAFELNIEATVLLTSKDNKAKDILSIAMKLVKDSWKSAQVYDKDKLSAYTVTWRNHRMKINSLSGKYGSDKRDASPIHQVPIISMTWQDFMIQVRNDKIHSLEDRIKVIDTAKNLFYNKINFGSLTEDERKFIAGVQNKFMPYERNIWALFGNMSGRGSFAHEIIRNNKSISDSLNQIPLSGQITKSHYDNFIKYYKKAFKGNYLGTATRLLAMKRPDIFVCLVTKNKSGLCKNFGIKQSEMDYERYWGDIIERIYDCEWWQNPKPKDAQEAKVSEARAAFLDSLYYEE